VRRPGFAAAALALLLAACGAAEAGAELTPPGPYKVALRDSPRRGAAVAWVTVVEYSDFQCPSCKAAEPAVAAVLAAPEADVRLVHRQFPLTLLDPTLHPAALPAAEASECARLQPRAGSADGRFWEVHDALFARQAELVAAAAGPGAFLRDVAGAAGLDLAAWDACMAGDATLARIRADFDEGLQAFGVGGTPTFIVNGTKVVGAGGLGAAVDAARAWAVQSGIPRAEFYDRAVLGL
jgi:protein-disulfide isomerase